MAGLKLLYAFLLFYLLRSCSGLIETLNATQYATMPALYALDPWESCALRDDWLYCLTDFALVSDKPSSLLDMIHEYSDVTFFRYNHSQIHRGICVTDTCKDLLKDYTSNKTMDLNGVLVACQNRTIWRDYQLQVNLEKVRNCNSGNEKIDFDVSDVAMLIVYFTLIALNIIGTVYDKLICKEGKGNPYMLAFSLPRNWAKLVVSADKVPDPRLLCLRPLYGMKTIMMFFVLMSHVFILTIRTYLDNTQFFEVSNYTSVSFSGQLMVHVFFMISGLLVSFSFQLYAENHKITWFDLPKSIMLRWLRLTPLYAFILGTVSTLVRHMGSGPLWHLVVTEESAECRQYWWSNLLFFNNYVQDNLCLGQTWYLACEMQLFVMAMIICLVARTPRKQKMVLAIFLVVSIIIVGTITYIFDLDATLLHRIKYAQNFFKYDKTYNLVFIPGHTNMSSYLVGLAGGFVLYYCQRKNKDFSKYRRYGILFLLLHPFLSLMNASVGIFFQERPLLARVAYAALHKVIFNIGAILVILAFILKIEVIQRRFLRWRGFTWTARVTFGVYLLHSIVQRGMFGIMQQPIHLSMYLVVILLTSSLFISYVLSAILWLLLENPIATVVKVITRPSTPPRSEKEPQETATGTQNPPTTPPKNEKEPQETVNGTQNP